MPLIISARRRRWLRALQLAATLAIAGCGSDDATVSAPATADQLQADIKRFALGERT